MRKADLTRRAELYTRGVGNLNSQFGGTTDDVAGAWEAGYRAARTDLRNVIKHRNPGTNFYVSFKISVTKWLRPIR